MPQDILPKLGDTYPMIWWPTHLPTLQHGLITLRPPQESDIPNIFQSCQDSLIPKFTTIPAVYTMAHAEFFVREKAPNSFIGQTEILFIIEYGVGADAQFGGAISFHSMDLTDHVAEIGYWVAAPVRDKKIGTIAARVITDYGFTTMGFRRIEALVDVENIHSRKMLASSGYTLEAIMRNKVTRADGTQKDMALFGQTNLDWKGI